MPIYVFSSPDVKLIVGTDPDTAVFEVHEYVLAPQSGFFHKALSNGMKESQTKVVKLPEIEPETIRLIVSWFYRVDVWTSVFQTLPRTKKNGVDALALFRACDYLQIGIITTEYGNELMKMIEKSSYICVYSGGGEAIPMILEGFYAMGGSFDNSKWEIIVSKLNGVSMGELNTIVMNMDTPNDQNVE
ncbi:hypothetical protein TWF694_002687 [Orbilia ellipsospora]|uniref:BTB domain-containing protein n=1 Tax=Orbilia ellipsospora TaxID=2528407 RepID=A0AAV9X2R0_9PEZI